MSTGPGGPSGYSLHSAQHHECMHAVRYVLPGKLPLPHHIACPDILCNALLEGRWPEVLGGVQGDLCGAAQVRVPNPQQSLHRCGNHAVLALFCELSYLIVSRSMPYGMKQLCMSSVH